MSKPLTPEGLPNELNDRFERYERLSSGTALALYEREFAWFRADEPFLTVEKAAERCAKLSLLLTQAHAA
jgi:hypothetical protein